MHFDVFDLSFFRKLIKKKKKIIYFDFFDVYNYMILTVTFDVYNYMNFSQNWMTVTFDMYNYINFSQNGFDVYNYINFSQTRMIGITQ